MEKGSFRKLKLQELGRPDLKTYVNEEKIPLYVVLDNIRSLNNIGSVFRTCDAFLVKELLLVGITAKPPHREIQKTALGATESVKWKHFPSNRQALSYLTEQNVSLISVEQTTNSVLPDELKIDQGRAYALILGNEVDGVQEDFIQVSEQVLEIPQFGTKHSLNISVAAGISIWEVYQRMSVK